MISQLLGILHLIPGIIILVAVIMIQNRVKSVAGVLLIVAQSVTIITQLFSYVLMPVVLRYGTGTLNYQIIYGAISAVSFLSWTLFAIGLILLATQHLSKK